MALPIALAACGGAAQPAPTTAPPAAAAATIAPTTAPATEPAATLGATAEPTAEPTQAPTEAAVATATQAPAATEVATATVAAEAAPTAAKLNLNAAPGDQYLSAIPGFPNRMVREFLEYRPYVSIQQFRREIGKYVDSAQVAEWEKYVYVPVNVDESDAETLKQLPGVDDAIAAQLIAGRPYGSNDAFLAKLTTLVSATQAAEAPAYLGQ